VKTFWQAVFWGSLAGLIIGSGALFKAHADPVDPLVAVYAAKHTSAVCETLAIYPTFAGVEGVAEGIQEDGFTAYQSGQIIALSVEAGCPQRLPLLNAFANQPTQRAESLA
jgi:hypothetical protein